MKKLIATILSLTLIFSACFIGSAGYENIEENAEEIIDTPEENEGLPFEETVENVSDEAESLEGDSEEEEEAYHVPPAEKEGSLARIYLCSKTNKGKVGHIFIYVENLTDEPLQVGLVTLEKDQGVSMGSFGFQRSDGWGVYCNTESFLYSKNAYSSIICISEELDSAHLKKLNKFLNGYNYWELFINCVYFAAGAWNSCTGRFILPMSFPFTCRLQIRMHKSRAFTQMYKPERDNVYHVKGVGSRQRLVVCSDKSLK